ncbi:MAG: Fe-S protein assembly chaperone HscA [Alphaproteobacteria bacterium]|nr:Fe-S protein assembly chaperone HscA [Alphaproteobacteria bacterium]
MAFLDIHEPGATPLPHAGQDIAVGIDLGTTNSLVAVARDGKPEVLRDPRGGTGLVPSIVAYPQGGSALVGDAARLVMLDEPERVVSSIKRLMGRGIDDVQILAGTRRYEVLAAAAGEMVRLRIGGRILSPVEISAEILRALKARAEQSLGRPVTQSVITVPAYFDDAARTATKDAARLAGLQVLRLVNEPTAAALAYGLDKEAEGLFAVYDLGGGTFDVSILRLERGVFQVIATGGDAALGGDDFDQAVAEHFLAAAPHDRLSPGEVQQALFSARLAKECLTTQETGEWWIVAGGQRKAHRLDRTGLEQIVDPIVARTLAIFRQVLIDAKLTADRLSGVVLVGGSTRMPLVRRRVAEFFQREPLADINPDEVVALGAALQAEALTHGSDTLLLDVTPLSLGLETMGGLVEKLIPRNTPIPVAKAQEFTTYQDGQDAMMIHVVQGEREVVDQNRSLARFTLTRIPAMVASAARITVTFAVDADGLLTVSAREKTTGREQAVVVKPSYGLSPEDMERMLRDSMVNARDDMNRRLVTESQVEGKRAVLAVESALAKDGDLLDTARRHSIETEVAALKQALDGTDRSLIQRRIEALDRATRSFAELRMDRGIRDALKGVQIERLERRLTGTPPTATDS